MTKRELNRAILEACLPPIQKLILFGYLEHANKEGVAWPSKATLCMYTGAKVRAVQANRMALVEAGYLHMTQCLPGKTPRYQLTMTPAADAPPAADASPAADARGGAVDARVGEQEMPGGGAADAPEPYKRNLPLETSQETLPPKGSDLWDEINSKLVAQGKRKLKLTPARRRALNARVKEHSREDVLLVIDWWLTSSHDRADYIRKHHTIDTLFRASKFDAYVELASIVEMTEEEKFMQTYARLESEAETTPTERDHR